MASPKGGAAVEPGLLSRIGGAIRYAVTGNADFFGPGTPIAPVAQEQAHGRQWDYPAGSISPRSRGPTSRSASRAPRARRQLRSGAPRDRDAEGPDGEAPLGDSARRRRQAGCDRAGDPEGAPRARSGARLPRLVPDAAGGSARHRRAGGLHPPDAGWRSVRASSRSTARRSSGCSTRAAARRRRRPTAKRSIRSDTPRTSRSSRACRRRATTPMSCVQAAESARAQGLRLLAGRADAPDRQHRAPAPGASARVLHRGQRPRHADGVRPPGGPPSRSTSSRSTGTC
jgi:hypothetical protein